MGPIIYSNFFCSHRQHLNKKVYTGYADEQHLRIHLKKKKAIRLNRSYMIKEVTVMQDRYESGLFIGYKNMDF